MVISKKDEVNIFLQELHLKDRGHWSIPRSEG